MKNNLLDAGTWQKSSDAATSKPTANSKNGSVFESTGKMHLKERKGML